MKNRHAKKSAEFQEIANERIIRLFELARLAKKKEHANRYVSIACSISTKYKIKIRPELRMQFCRHCHSFLRPGVNCRVRVSKGKVISYCLDCRKYSRNPYIKEKKEKLKKRRQNLK